MSEKAMLLILTEDVAKVKEYFESSGADHMIDTTTGEFNVSVVISAETTEALRLILTGLYPADKNALGIINILCTSTSGPLIT